MVIANGRRVSIEYTLRLDDGSTADTNVGGPPLTYEEGAGEILPALEAALVGAQIDEIREIRLAAEDGYGLVDPEAFEEVGVDAIPSDAREVGVMLVACDEEGNEQNVRVAEVYADRIIVDLNHPLAGQDLVFEVRILAVE